MSWYDIVLRLKLPELLRIQREKAPALPESATIVEHLVMALMRDASLRNRQDVTVTLGGMAAVHTPSLTLSRMPTGLRPLDPIQSFAVDTSNATQPVAPSLGLDAYQAAHATDNKSLGAQKMRARPQSAGPRYHASKQKSGHAAGGGGLQSNRNGKFSAENAIPDDRRTRSLQRQFMTVKQLLEESRSMQKSMERETRRLAVSDLERAKMQESLQTIHKVPCGCCQVLFLPVNLPVKVSRKAILDNRIKWSGRLNSRTIFGGRDTTRSLTGADDQWEGVTSKEEQAAAAAAAAKEEEEEALIAREKCVPRCYDQVGVCLFCAQFFQEPEKYRPSYRQIVFEEKKAAFLQQKEREREWWDPLRMVEKDREELEKYLERKQQEEERERQRLEDEEKRRQEEAALAAAEEEKVRLKKTGTSPLKSPKASKTVQIAPSPGSVKGKS